MSCYGGRVSAGRTVEDLEHLALLPVQTFTVEVVGGADAGKRRYADEETMTIGTAAGNDLTLSDDTVSGYHLELAGRDDGVLVIDHGSTNGTRVGTALIHKAVVSSGSLLEIGKTRLRVTIGDQELLDVPEPQQLGKMVGATPQMRRLMALVRKAAASDIPVLLVGESGTGKELIAHGLHTVSRRADKPFVTVDCASLSPSLVASELFGHERGAFTGAERQHAGAFERADGGTLFLDEVGELPLDLQSHLLGVLERHSFRRVGGKEQLAVDVRIVAASNRDLRKEVNAGSFRLDLYYRLAVVRVTVPPLRERLEDLPLLIEQFLREQGYLGDPAVIVPADTMDLLMRHHWRGNVRELRNFVHARLAIGDSVRPEEEEDQASEPPDDTIPLRVAVPVDLRFSEARAAVLRDFEAAYLRWLLEAAGGNVSKAARDAGVARSYLNTLLRRHDLR